MADVSNFPNVTPVRESLLIDRIRAGNTELFADLVRPYCHSLEVVLRSILRDPSDVEDVLQETMLKALVHLHQLHDEENFKSWLLQIGRNEARSRRRRIRKTWSYISLSDTEVAGDEESENGSYEVADRCKPASEAVADNELRAAIALVMNSLPKIYRGIFVLHDIKQLSLNEAAKMLGISIAAGTSRLHRARQHLRQQLTAFFSPKSKPPTAIRAKNDRTGT